MKKFINYLFNSVFCVLVIFTTVFFTREYDAYRSQPLYFNGSILEPFTQEGIHIAAKAYSRKESSVYLDRDLMQKGLQPLQVTIQNNSKKSYYLSNRGLDMPNLSSKEVARKITLSAIPRSIALRIAGFFFWPIMIPATIDSMITTYSYFNIKWDYYAKSIKERPELILPYSTVNRIIFLPANQKADQFTLYLQDPHNGAYHPFYLEIQG